MPTPLRTARAIVCAITSQSPAWTPQAMLADEITSSSASSLPMGQGPKLSPRSAFRSTGRVMMHPPDDGR